MSRGFEDAKGKANKALAEAITKSLEPMYCTKCGSRLQVRSVQQKGFDKDTGYPKYDVILRCQHVILYETSFLGIPLFTWKAPFGRHSVHRVSMLIELNSDLADAHYQRGDAHHEKGEYFKAIAEYGLAIKLNPNHALAYYKQGLAYYKRGLAYHVKGEVSRAVDSLEKCAGLSTDPELTKAAQQALSEIKNSH